MATKSVTLQLDEEAAEVFSAASEADRHKLDGLLSLWLREWAASPGASLGDVMDTISDRAQARGLTPEILESLRDAQ